MSNLKFLFYFLYISILLFALGCAQTLRVESISSDLNVGKSNNGANNARVAIEPFKVNSKYQKDNVIGEAKVGLVNSKADIVSNEPVSSIVTSEVKRGFRDAGFNVVDLRDADFIVTGMVEKFWVDEYATGLSLEYSKGSVRYDMIIKNRQGATVWANTLDAFKASEKSMDTTENNIATLSLALKESVEAIFRDQTFWNAFTK
jgi:hypothetical protein